MFRWRPLHLIQIARKRPLRPQMTLRVRGAAGDKTHHADEITHARKGSLVGRRPGPCRRSMRGFWAERAGLLCQQADPHDHRPSGRQRLRPGGTIPGKISGAAYSRHHHCAEHAAGGSIPAAQLSLQPGAARRNRVRLVLAQLPEPGPDGAGQCQRRSAPVQLARRHIAAEPRLRGLGNGAGEDAG